MLLAKLLSLNVFELEANHSFLNCLKFVSVCIICFETMCRAAYGCFDFKI